MDDLDHSMHIAEYDWTSFYEESEECGLLQPSLACPDISCLSDSEDSVNSSSVFSKGQREPQPRPAANSDEAERNAACCCTEELQINPMIGGTAAATLQTVQPNAQSSDGDVQTESDTCQLKSAHEADICNRAELHVNGPSIAHIGVSEDASSVASRAEKERWFVTVNDSPVRQRARAPPVKKKRRQKKTRKHMCRNTGQQTLELGLELEINKDINDSEAGRDTAGGNESAEENPEGDQTGVISDVSGEGDNSSEKVVISRPRIENRIDATTDRNKHDPSSSAATLHDTLTPSDSSRLDCLVSYELEDDVEFLSTHSYDSESYLSATESLEEPPHLLVDTHQLQDSLPNNYLFNVVENTDAEDPSSCDSTLCNVTATNCEGYESTSAQPTLVSPSAGQHANKMPDVNSTCDKDTHSTLPCTPSDTPGPQNHKMNISASGCSSGDRLSPLPVPDLTVTPCPVADSPETYAKAAGHPRPVYAISAFWDEMEKLTINDILQLRMGRSTSPRDTQETVTPDADDFPTNRGSVVDTVEYNLPDGGLMDASDAADSDYFTQPDESKLGRSSCEFSTSDFEEDYWQFLGASRNSSPDPPKKNQQGTSDSPFSEEEESTASEGKETPVPSEDFAGQCFEHQDSNDLTWPRQIIKSKSVRNVQALNTEDVSLQVLLGNDEDSLSSDRCPSPEETVLLNTSDSLGTLISAPFLSNTHVDMFEYFFPKRDARCVHDPEDIPVFDYTVCTFRDETSFSSLHDSQCGEVKPIPIFSCSHPTVRELTFPNTDYVFLIADFKEEAEISPIRVVSRAFIQGRDCGTPAAAPRGFRSGKGLLSIRKIGFHDKGSMWCGRSGAWVFPVEAEKIPIKRADPPVTVLTEGGVASTPSQLFRELAVQRRILGTLQTTRREGIFSSLKQSDMCLVCIAFASWVLRSSDPEAADAWKAALLANVSALSAIQYLRHYVKKKMNPSQDDP